MPSFNTPFCALLSCLVLAACGQTQTDASVDIAWPERQSIYRLNAERTQLDVYSLRGGIAPLGSVHLPPSLCPTAMTLDERSNRLWLWSNDEAVEIDARSLRVLQQWRAGSAQAHAVPPGVTLRSLRFRASSNCLTREKTLQAMSGHAGPN